MKQFIELSPESYDEWIKIIFDHPIHDEADRIHAWYAKVEFTVADATTLVLHMTKLCQNFVSVTNAYTLEQINQGIWLLLGPAINFGNYLLDGEVPLEARLECIQSMYRVYADFVALSQVEVMENCFDMWWDMVGGNFWHTALMNHKGEEIMAAWEKEAEEMSEEEKERSDRISEILSQMKPEEDAHELLKQHGLSLGDPFAHPQPAWMSIEVTPEELNEDEWQILNAMLETLTKILSLEDERCQGYALHGLGHLHHPQVPRIVQKFIDEHHSEWPEETLIWVEQCRDGTVM